MTQHFCSTESKLTEDGIVVRLINGFYLLDRIYMGAAIFLAFIGPIFGSVWLWDEDFFASMNFNIARYVLGLHVNWAINSFAHMHGTRPYDK